MTNNHFNTIIEDNRRFAPPTSGQQEIDHRFQAILKTMTDEELRFYKEAIYQEENRRFKERIQNKEPGLQLIDEEKKMVVDGYLVKAMKTYRARNGTTIMEAKTVVEAWANERKNDLVLEPMNNR